MRRAILSILFSVVTLYSFGQFHALLATPTDTDYQTYLNALAADGVTLPSQDIQIAQNEFVKDLKAAGLWSRMKTGYFYHSGEKTVGLYNLKNPSTYKASFVGTTAIHPIQLERTGMRGGIGGYVNQPFKSNEYAGIQTDLTMIQYIPRVPFSEYVETNLSHGMRTTSGGLGFSLYPFYSSGTGFSGHSATSHSFTSTKHEGLYVQTYNGTQQVIYKDGTKTTNTITPTVPTDAINRFIGAFNNNGTPTGTYGHFIAADFLFNRFDDTDESTFRTIFNEYKTAINLGGNNFVAEYASHCWFAREKFAYDAGTNKSWLGQCHADAYNAGGTYSQYIFEINNNTNAITKFKLGTVTEQDDHNEPSILIRASDSKLIAAYTEHSGSTLRWRISTNATDASAWGSQQTFDPDGAGTHDYTYASIFQDASGDIFIFFRDATSSGGSTSKWSYVKSTDDGATFGSYTTFSDFTYANIAQNPSNKDIFHFIVSEHPGDGDFPNYIATFYFDAGAGTFHKTDGTNITANIPISASHATIIQSNNSPVQCWIEDIMVDPSTGYPRVLFNLIPDETTSLDKDEYYSEWNGSAWTNPYLLHRASTHYMETELFVSSLDSKWYAPLGSFDRGNVNRIIYSKETAGQFGNVCEIFETTRISHNSFTTPIQRSFDSQYDQWRPFSIPSPTNNVFWLNKILYDHWSGSSGGYYQTLVIKTF